MGRWEPSSFPLGSQMLDYEWRVFSNTFLDPGEDEWDWWCDHVVDAWKEIPAIAMETRQGGNAVPSRSDDSAGRQVSPNPSPTPSGGAE